VLGDLVLDQHPARLDAQPAEEVGIGGVNAADAEGAPEGGLYAAALLLQSWRETLHRHFAHSPQKL
jgi:hypothetical protein